MTDEKTIECQGCEELEQLLIYSHRKGWNISRTESGFRAGKRFSNGNMRLIPLESLHGALARLQEIDRSESRKLSAAQYSRRRQDADYE